MALASAKVQGVLPPPLRLRLLEEVPKACAASAEDAALLAAARHPDPARVLGLQAVEGGRVALRAWVSGAGGVSVASQAGVEFEPLGGPDVMEDPPEKVALWASPSCPSDCAWLFEAVFEACEGTCPGIEELRSLWRYSLEVEYTAGGGMTWADPYSLGKLLSEPVLRAWASGDPVESPATTFGAHHMELRDLRPGLWGTRFALWAPHAEAVSVVGDFDFWDARAHPMCRRSEFGVWELFLPLWDLRGQKYGFSIAGKDGKAEVKADAFGLEFVEPINGSHDAKVPATDDFSRSFWGGEYGWNDAEWLRHRTSAFSEENWSSQPLSIYEVHLPSWAASAKFSLPPEEEAEAEEEEAAPEEAAEAGSEASPGRRGGAKSEAPLTYRTIAEPLARHIKEMGFCAVEFLPLSQYPADQSWGYQCACGLYAVDSRLGSPDDFRFLVDTLHRHSIAVFIDFVGAHFAKDSWGLVRYSGAPQFEYEGDLGELPGWGTARFNYGKPEVRSYLFGAAEHWIDSFHVDGLRLDAVAAMVYGSFGREEDGDAILAGRGVVNEEGVAFLRGLTARLRQRRPGVLLSAEESTNFKWVTSRPPEVGDRASSPIPDLGFHLKWNMGFTYDALAFLGTELSQRPRSEVFGWKKLAWYLAYAFNERWVLPLSHDNLNSRSLLEQMSAPGEVDREAQLAHLRLLLAYYIAMPGRPLLFMGGEIGEGGWNYEKPIDWEAAGRDRSKRELKDWVSKLLRMYRDCPALHRQDDSADSFAWLDKDEAGRCIYAWRRRTAGAADVVCALNASPHPASASGSCRLPLAWPGAARRWRLLGKSAPGANLGESDSAVVDVPPAAAHLELELPGFSAQLWIAEEDGSLPAPDGVARLRVELRHPGTAAGEVVHLVGASSALGDWNPSAAPALATSPEVFPLWSGEVEIPLEGRSGLDLEFKFVTLRADGSATWEPIEGNRHVVLRGGGAAATEAALAASVCCEFGRM